MSKNEYSSISTNHSGFSIPDFTADIEQVNFIYANPEIKKLVHKYEKPLLKKKIIRKSYLDSYYYICSTINHLSKVDKRFKEYEYVPLSYEILASIVNEKRLTEFIANLKEWGVIATNGSYQAGIRSTGFKLLKPYNRNVKKIMIKDNTTNRKINEYRKKEHQQIREMPYPYQYLEYTNTWIEINATEANKLNIKSYWSKVSKSGELNKQYDSNFSAISGFKDYRFKPDEFGNRVHTNLTNLNSDFRYTLSVQGDKLGQVDISNSQPLFFYKLIEHNADIPTEEKIRYKNIVENARFYEYFMEEFKIAEDKRDDTKQKILTGMFSDKNRKDDSRYFKYFRKDFPHITSFITKVKTTNQGIINEKISGHKDYYKNLICLMQREETRFVIEKVVAEFIARYEGQFIATIHDSIVVKTEMLETARDLMLECFQSEGLNPKLKKQEFRKGGEG